MMLYPSALTTEDLRGQQGLIRPAPTPAMIERSYVSEPTESLRALLADLNARPHATPTTVKLRAAVVRILSAREHAK